MADATEVAEVGVIKQQIADQREALAEKLETLETQVVGKVEQATEAVSHAVDKVTDTVQASVETVRETLDVRRQVELHPWAMVGGSVAVGMLGAWLLRGKRGWEHSPQAPALSSVVAQRPVADDGPPRPSWLTQVSGELRPEMLRLKELAVGALLGLVRDAVVDVTPPQMRHDLVDVADRITRKLGGAPLHGRVLPPDGVRKEAPV